MVFATEYTEQIGLHRRTHIFFLKFSGIRILSVPSVVNQPPRPPVAFLPTLHNHPHSKSGMSADASRGQAGQVRPPTPLWGGKGRGQHSLHKCLRIERRQIFGLLARSDEKNRRTQFASNAEYDTALGRAVELGVITPSAAAASRNAAAWASAFWPVEASSTSQVWRGAPGTTFPSTLRTFFNSSIR
jgi:hypothetical protein